MEMDKTDKKIKMEKENSVPQPVEAKKKKRGGKFSKLLFLVVLGALIYSQYQLYVLKNPDYQRKLIEEKNSSIVKDVSKLMVLPAETPQIVYVQDADKLKEQQQFFKNAMNGDALLVYKDTAVLYSPSKNKIVNVGPIIRDSSGAVSPTGDSDQPVPPKPVVKQSTSTTTKK